VTARGLLDRRRASSGRREPVTAGDLLRRIGRALLWVLVVVLLVRGVSGTLVGSEPVRQARVARSAVPAWPNEEARAFAADFARAYLTFAPEDPGGQLEAVAPFVSPELADSIIADVGDHPERAVSVVVARSAAIDKQRALITVAVGGVSGTRYLAVPVARDRAGGLVVDELPSFAPAPRRASRAPATLDPVTGPQQGELRDVVSRFLRTYLAGDQAGLSYLVPAGVRLATPAPRSYELVDVDALARLGLPAAREVELQARVRVRDLRSGAFLAQAYRLRLAQRDRWYVADVNSSREG
jgi:hypothetical protein